MSPAPQRPEPAPLEVNMTRIVGLGTALWTLALLGLLPFTGWLDRTGRLSWIGVCGAGIALGLLGLYVCRRRDRRLSAHAEPSSAP